MSIKTLPLAPSLAETKVGDYVCYSVTIGRGGSRLLFRKVAKKDDKGRLYLSAGEGWQRGFDPQTGTNAAKATPIRVPTPAELAIFLRGQAESERKRHEQEQRQSQQDWRDASFLASCDTDMWLEHFTPEELSRIAKQMRIAERLRVK